MRIHHTHYIVVNGRAGAVVASQFHAPNDKAAAIMARAYVRSLVAHTKKTHAPIKAEMCRLYRYKDGKPYTNA